MENQNQDKIKRVNKRTWLGWLNIIVLQWFFIRLARNFRDDELTGFSVIGLILPMTGWGLPYAYIFKFNIKIITISEDI